MCAVAFNQFPDLADLARSVTGRVRDGKAMRTDLPSKRNQPQRNRPLDPNSKIGESDTHEMASCFDGSIRRDRLGGRYQRQLERHGGFGEWTDRENIYLQGRRR